MPDLTEVSDDGIGFFRDVWTIVDVSASEAWDVLNREQALLHVVDELAATAEDFDRLARCVECWDPDEAEGDISGAEYGALESAIGDSDSSELGGLDLGVSALVHAMASSGMVPAASCRGHVGTNAWSAAPVVFFATDETHAKALEPLARAAGCVFDIDPSRSDLLIVGGKSVVDLMQLATLLNERRDAAPTL